MTRKPQETNSSALENQALLACLEVGKLLASTVEIKEILALIMEKVSRLIEAENWSLLLKDESTSELVFEIVAGDSHETLLGVRIPSDHGVVGHVMRTGEPLILADTGKDHRFSTRVDRITGFETRTLVCVPLAANGKTVGAMEIVNVREPEAFGSRHLPVLAILADYAAIAIEKARAFDEIRRMSLTDEYTGLYNARYLAQVLDAVIADARENGQSFSVVFVDVDNFKSIVDSRGHLAGSLVLKQVGQAMRGRLADKDILVKYGGDEYVIVLPRAGRTEARDVIESIRAFVRQSRFPVHGQEDVQVTASFGIAVFPDDAQTKKDLLTLADQRLYRIKRSTKDGVAER